MPSFEQVPGGDACHQKGCRDQDAEQQGDQARAEALRRKAFASQQMELGLTRSCDITLVVSEAEQVLQRAAAISRDCPEVHYQLFLIYSRLKRQADATREQAIFKELEAEGLTRQKDQTCEPDNRDLPSAFEGKPTTGNQ